MLITAGIGLKEIDSSKTPFYSDKHIVPNDVVKNVLNYTLSWINLFNFKIFKKRDHSISFEIEDTIRTMSFFLYNPTNYTLGKYYITIYFNQLRENVVLDVNCYVRNQSLFTKKVEVVRQYLNSYYEHIDKTYK